MQLKYCKSCHTNYGPHLKDCPHCGHRKFKMRNIDFWPRLSWFSRIIKQLQSLLRNGKEVMQNARSFCINQRLN